MATLLWLMSFPLQAQRHEVLGHFRYLHICVVVLAIVLPFGPIAGIFATGGFLPLYYPHICTTATSDTTYYAFSLPHSICTATGLSLLILLFWVLVRSRWREILLVIKLKALKVRKKQVYFILS